ncbi:MAG: MBL fold metallo-hydrolase [Candidatus Aenigmatarchaeota archaeon]|nr:MBL fold metallo-hydrolase [Candidatus Aenigmarchaeota archaeon]
MSANIFYNGSLNLDIDGKTISLDPEINVDADIIFISHAHMDHSINAETVIPKITSHATRELIQFRKGIDMINTISFDTFDLNGFNVKMLDSGHVIGSKSLLLKIKNKKIFYTGDICDKHRFHMKSAEIPNSDIMILESTYGSEFYEMPSITDVIDRSTEWIKAELENGNSLALFGYPLGKAQIISKIAEQFDVAVILHDYINQINNICRKYNFSTRDFISLSNAPDGFEGQAIYILPSSSRKASSIKNINGKMKTAMFSGWAIEEDFKVKIGVDEAFALTDHADFKGLLKIVKQSSPEKVFTFHGFKEELAENIKERLGIDAEPIKKGLCKLF